MLLCACLCMSRERIRQLEERRFAQIHTNRQHTRDRSPHGASLGAGAFTPCRTRDLCSASTSSTKKTHRPQPFHSPAFPHGEAAAKRLTCSVLLICTFQLMAWSLDQGGDMRSAHFTTHRRDWCICGECCEVRLWAAKRDDQPQLAVEGASRLHVARTEGQRID